MDWRSEQLHGGSFQMGRLNYARRSGVIVDLCRAHGLWFDHEELRRVIEFIRSGGLREAAEHEAERVRKEIERKLHEQQYLNDDPHAEEKRKEFEMGVGGAEGLMAILFRTMDRD